MREATLFDGETMTLAYNSRWLRCNHINTLSSTLLSNLNHVHVETNQCKLKLALTCARPKEN